MAGLPHLFVHDGREVTQFTNPAGGPDRSCLPDRERQTHAALLRHKLNQAWELTSVRMQERRAITLPCRNGVYLEFKSASGSKLPVHSLEQIRSGVRLLNVRQDGAPGQEITTATVYIPENSKRLFLNKLAQYETENTKKNRPRHENLFAPIEDIRVAMLESFWLDPIDSMPGDEYIWCEAWLQGESQEILDHIFDVSGTLGIIVNREEVLKFPERMVVLIKANRQQLVSLIESSPYIAEYRKARSTPGFFTQLDNNEQAEWVQDLLARLKILPSDVSVCILDTGVNNGHPLLAPVLANRDCQAYQTDWGAFDDGGHGTLMAGVVAYGDLAVELASGNEIEIAHRLESVKIIRPSQPNHQDLYGYITQQGVHLAEIANPTYKRTICMAITSSDGPQTGRPSSWSGAIDALTSGYYDDQRRLFIVSVGTIPVANWGAYPETNLNTSVEDPAQSWNALSVGSYTQKDLVTDKTYGTLTPIARSNQISPSTTTSLNWDRRWPAKPDIVFEGGNGVCDDSGFYSDWDELSLLTTSHQPHRAFFASFWGTSASTALAARLAAKIQIQYPDSWPETVRGLMVHSAEWTPEMKDQFISTGSRGEYRRLLHICGYGVPNTAWCLTSSQNRLTLIAEAEMQPFEKSSSGACRTREMHLYELPWPREVLRELGDTLITMRVTISYFIEPAPGEIGWGDRYRYPSHGLRFDVNSPHETKEQFLVRLNKAARDEGQRPNTSSDSARWVIGQASDLGSVHSDFWTGTAADVAECNYIGIYPTTGWWKLRPHLGRYDRLARYSLIVSLQTPDLPIDIYTPVANKVTVSVMY